MQLWNFSKGTRLYEFKVADCAIKCLTPSPALDVVGIGLADGCAPSSRVLVSALCAQCMTTSFCIRTLPAICSHTYSTHDQPAVQGPLGSASPVVSRQMSCWYHLRLGGHASHAAHVVQAGAAAQSAL